MNLTKSLIVIIALALCAPALLGQTSISADITTDTTWNNAGSPYEINTGGDFYVTSDATLTVDTTSGNVGIDWLDGETFDFIVTEGATLVIKAVSGSVTFGMTSATNIRITSTGRITWSDDTGSTTFTRLNSNNEPGALIFEADQSRQSDIKNAVFSYMGNDGRDGAIVVEDNGTLPPLLEGLSFSDCTTSAIRFDGKGINTLRQDGLKPPFSVTNTDYVFFLNAVTSTVPIRFPDPTAPASAEAYLTGTCTVGDGSDVSHWRFDDSYVFKCADSSKLEVVNGSVWGTVSDSPTFEAVNESPGFGDWVGLVDEDNTHINTFGGIGPFAFLTVRNAAVGIDINKGTSFVPQSGQVTPWKFPGLTVKKCTVGVSVRTYIDGSGNGYTTILSGLDAGSSAGADECNSACVSARYGRVVLQDCLVGGAVSNNISIGDTAASSPVDVAIQDSHVTDSAGGVGIMHNSHGSTTSLLLERSIVDGHNTGIIFQTVVTYTSARSLTIRNCAIYAPSGQCLTLNSESASVCTVLVEDSMLHNEGGSGSRVGVSAQELRASSTALFRRTVFVGCERWGALIIDDLNNLCEYTFEECWFDSNGDNTSWFGGFRDARTNAARSVLTRCTFTGNKPQAVYDGDATTTTSAADCYWGASNGPSGAGPGSGDAVTSNVDFSPFLDSPYIGWLIGGSPAGASRFEIWEDGSTPADALHVIANRPYLSWDFASDFSGGTQSAYQIEVASSPSFTSSEWSGTKTTSSTTSVQYPTTGGGVSALVDGTLYYTRIRLWDQNDLPGPWYYTTFRLNSAPGQVGDTDRSPADHAQLTDWTPVFVWQRATDADEDPLHFEVSVTDGSAAYSVKSWAPSTFNGSPPNTDARANFEISTDGGTTWLQMPQDGAPAGDTIHVRLTWPDDFGLGNYEDPDWDWAVRAYDGFEFGAWSTTRDFELERGYTLSGTLTVDGEEAIVGATIRVVYMGVVLDETEAETDGSGDFIFDAENALDEPLKVGDILILFVDGAEYPACRVFQFNGSDMAGLDLVQNRVYVGPSLPGGPISTTAFQDDVNVDGDLPWEYTGDVEFGAEISGDTGGVWVDGSLEVNTGFSDNSNVVELHIEATGLVRACGQDVSFYKLFNEGRLELRAGATLTINSTGSASSGPMLVYDSSVVFSGASALSLTVNKATLDARGATFKDATANISELVIDSATASQPATFSCRSSMFDEVRLTIETDGVLASFEGNTFQNDLASSSQHIHWKSTSPLSATQMRDIQFNTNVSGLGAYNVTATSGANNINMIGCSGVGMGEAFENDSNNKVDWDFAPPTGLVLTAGDTRVRLQWNDVLGSSAGFQDSGTATSVATLVLTDTGATWTADAFIGMSLRMGTNPGNYRYYPITDNGTTTITVNASYNLAGDGWGVGSAYRVSGMGYNIYRATSEGGTYNPVNPAPVHGGTEYIDTSLTNTTTYWYYVTAADNVQSTPVESGGSARRSTTPQEASIELLTPAEATKGDPVAVTVVGAYTHWTGSGGTPTLSYTGSNVTVHDTLFISPTLALTDMTLAGNATSGNVQVDVTDVWQIAAYDESETSAFTANDSQDLETRPSLTFTTNGGAIAADGSTSGSFVIDLDFNDNSGPAIDPGTFEFFASRTVQVDGSPATDADPGDDMGTGALSIFDDSGGGDVLDTSGATANIEQTSNDDEELFDDGEYTVFARVANSNGVYSEWATLRFYVEGNAADVVKVSGGALLYHGETTTITLTGTSLSTTVADMDFGSGITVDSASGGGSSMNVTLTVDELAACGPRTVTVNSAAKAGVVTIEYPTNILPTTTNAEPPRSAAVGGVNVLLKGGAFFKGETDIATRGRMMGLSWSRFYRSDITYNGPLGHGWVGHYFQRALVNGSNDINWYTPDGRKETFPDVAGGYTNPAGVYVVATRETTHNTITLRDRNGYSCVFNADGRLWKCIDRNGNSVECEYNYAGQLVKITDDRGKTWEVKYHNHGRVEMILDKVWDTSTPREVEYVYDVDGNLTQQKAPETSRYSDGDSNRITYGYRYDDAHRMIACINPREFNQSSQPTPYLEIFYDDQGRVTDQKLGDEADVVDGHIGKSAFIRLRYESSTLIREIDRAGHRTDTTIDASGRATDIKRYTAFWSVDTDTPLDHSAVAQELAKLRSGDPSYFQTVLTYNSNHEVLSVTMPRGNKTTYTYPTGSSQASGSANSCSGAELTKDAAGWTPDAFAGMTLRMGSDVGEYRYYPIASNTSDTITVQTGFSLSGDGWNADDFEVYDQPASPMAAGNVLVVTRSDEGLGSLSDIVTSYTYEPRYQLMKTVTDPRGNTTTYTYDYEQSNANDEGAGNVVKVTTPTITQSMAASAAITTRISYNQYGQPVTQIDGEGNVQRMVYFTAGDNDGFLKQSVRAVGELDLTSEYAYDKVGNLTGSWPPRAFDNGITKDDFKTTRWINELNQTWHTRGPKLTDNSGQQVDSYRYFDENGNVTHSFREYITAAGTAPSAPGDEDDPDTFTRSTTPMAATWHRTLVRYNMLNYAYETEVDAVAQSPINTLTTRTQLDSNYNSVVGITPLGNRSRTILDEREMVYRRIAGADSDVAGTYETDYDENGNVTASRDALGNETIMEYDGFDRATKSTDPAGNYRTTAYDANSNVIEIKAFDSFATLLAQGNSTYDQINRGWKSQRLALDHQGNPIGDGWATNTTVFDLNSRVVQSTDDNGVTYTSFYDAASRTLETVDAAGNRTKYNYNSSSATTKIDYLEVNELTAAIEKSHVEYVRDYADRVTESRDRRYNSGIFDTGVEAEYDYWGRVIATEDAAGTQTLQEYDLLSRQTRTTRKPTATTADWIVTERLYDDDSRVVTSRISKNPNTNTQWQETHIEHDERDRVITRRARDGDIWRYQYDVNGNLTERTDPLGTRVVNTYDARNLLKFRDITRGTGIVGTTNESIGYDGLGRVASCSNYDGSNLISATSYGYNTLSLVERLEQTVASSEGNILGTYVTAARYDATGFRTATEYWDGRVVAHYPDHMNRLSLSYDDTNYLEIASYTYAGPNRVVARVYGNGIQTNYQYESSGCGCGGSTAYVNRVEHVLQANGEVLFGVDRRYDETGNLTAERFDHEGGLGVAYRRDNTYRLTDTFYGVDLSSTALETYADPGNTPTTFGLHRAYTLDPRSNRSSVVEKDDSATTVYNSAYTLSTDENDLYTDVDGDSYNYDAIEQRTYDDATGLYYAYDYRGHLWLVDTDSNLATPEQVFHHDCAGNRILEEGWYDDSPSTNVHKTVLVNDIRGGGCGSGSGDSKAGEIRYNSSDVQTGQVQYVYGKGMGSMVHELATNGIDTVHRFRHEDQAGSLIGVTDINGHRTAEYFYLDFGTPVHRPIAFDGNATRIFGVAANTPSSGYTRITLSGVSLTPDEFNGKQLRVIGSLHIGEVLDTGTTTIDVADAGSSMYDLLSIGAGFVVLEFESPAPPINTAGTWDDVSYNGGSEETVLSDEDAAFTETLAVGDMIYLNAADSSSYRSIVSIDSDTVIRVAGDQTGLAATSDEYAYGPWHYDSGSDTSTYTNTAANFEDFMVGWLFTPNVQKPCYLQVIEVDTTNGHWVTVKGDARGSETTPVDNWRIHAPPGVGLSTGGSETEVVKEGARYLFTNFRYQAAQVGHAVVGQLKGSQPGLALTGTYYTNGASVDPTTATMFQKNEEPDDEGNLEEDPQRPPRTGRYARSDIAQHVPSSSQYPFPPEPQLCDEWSKQYQVSYTGEADAMINYHKYVRVPEEEPSEERLNHLIDWLVDGQVDNVSGERWAPLIRATLRTWIEADLEHLAKARGDTPFCAGDCAAKQVCRLIMTIERMTASNVRLKKDEDGRILARAHSDPTHILVFVTIQFDVEAVVKLECKCFTPGLSGKNKNIYIEWPDGDPFGPGQPLEGEKQGEHVPKE